MLPIPIPEQLKEAVALEGAVGLGIGGTLKSSSRNSNRSSRGSRGSIQFDIRRVCVEEERQLLAGGRLARRFFESIKEDPMKLGIEGE